MWRPVYHKIIAQVADALTTLISFVAAYYLWKLLRRMTPGWQIGSEIVLDPLQLTIMTVSVAVWVLIFSCQGAYTYQRFTSFTTETKIVLTTILWGSLFLIGLIFFLRPGYIPRSLVAIFIVTNVGLLMSEKYLLFIVANIIRRRGKNRKRVLVVGAGRQAKQFMETIWRQFHWGLDIIGFLDFAKDNVGREIYGKKVLGTIHDILPVLHEQPFDEVIIAVSTRRLGEVREVLEACELEGVQVRIISDFIGRIAKKFRADLIYGLPIISIGYVPENQVALAVKRGMDIIFSLFALILLAPFFLIIITAIKLSSPGPAFWKWNWVGPSNKPYHAWKFRTMVVGADKMKAQLAGLNEMTGPVFKIARDPRVTPIGRFLRKFSLDELPQLWTVLKGDMSLVGPRPPMPNEIVRYESWHRRKLSIKPGLTCLWQISGRNKINNFNDWVKMDLQYIDNWSLGLDIKIIFKTVIAVLRGTGV